MKYYSTLLAATALLISVTAKIPDYIHICKRNDPNITDCIHNSILSLRDKLAEGIPALNVPSIDPLHLAKLAINLGPGFEAEGRDLVLRGGRNFEIHDLVVDVEANTYTFAVTVPEIIATGSYEIDAKIASLPIRGKGPITLIAKSVHGQGTLRGHRVMRGGKTYNWFPSMTMKFGMDDYHIRLDNLFEGDPAIGEVTNKLLNEEKVEVMASFLPGLEKALISHILVCANSIVKTFTWDELFPET